MPRSIPLSFAGRSLLVAVTASLVVTPACGDSTDRAATVPTVTADPTDVADTDAFDFSNVVEIRDGSVAPAQAVAVVDQKIVLRNTTAASQTVRATNGTFGDTGPAEATIAPGEDFAFTQSTPISITYEVGSQAGLTGRIQVDPGIESI